MAEYQKPGLFAERGEGRPVQRAAAADCAYGRLVVEIKRLVPAQGVGSGWSLCENAHEPTRWRIIFSIALFPIAATARVLFRLTKLRKIFYAQSERRRFHTTSVVSGHLTLRQ